MPITMYPGQVNSPSTTLFSPISATDTSIPVADAAKLPSPPNIAVIGVGEQAETILYTGVSGNTLTGVTRGFQGTPRSWPAGTQIARLFTAYDYDALRLNVDELFGLVSQGLVEGNSAIVLSSQLPQAIKDSAIRAKRVFGDRIQICDGVDDHVEIQNALNAIPEGGSVTLIGGLFVGRTVTLASGKHVRGLGWGTVYKVQDGTNGPAFMGQGSGPDPYQGFTKVNLSHLTIDGNKWGQTSGDGVYIKWGLNCSLQNLLIMNCHDAGVFLEDCIRINVGNSVIQSSKYGIYTKDCVYGQNSFHNLFIWGIDLYGIYGLAATKENVDHNYEDIIIREVQEGVHLAGTGWASAGNIFCGVKIFFADRPGGIGVYLDPWSYENTFVSCFINDCETGFKIDGTHDVQVSGCQFTYIKRSAIVIRGEYNSVQNVDINGVCNSAHNTYSAIVIEGNYNKVRGCNIRSHLANKAKYGIEEIGASNHNIIENNALHDIVTQGIVKVGANTIVRHNWGYRTENGGVATFSGNGTQTQFTIPHGLAQAPTLVSLEAKTADAAGNKYWTADATNITVTFLTAPPAGTNNVIISWWAQV